MFIGASAAGILVLGGFWLLIAVAFFQGELSTKAILTFVALWLAGCFGLRFVLYGRLFLPFVALLDIGLVLAIFKGDIRIS